MSDRKIIIIGPLGNQFEAQIPCGTKLSKIAADFFEDQDLPMIDPKGRSFRVVIDLINPENRNEMKRLNANLDVCEILTDGDIISILPESVAGCFLGKTKVTLENDEKEFIENIKIGHKVLTGVPNSNRISIGTVCHIFEGIASSYLVINNRLHVTQEQPIWVNGQWKNASELKNNDFVQNRYGEKIRIESIENRLQPIKIFNIHVDSFEHTFFADNILVHNKIVPGWTYNINKSFENSIKVFLCHASDDKQKVRDLYYRLLSNDIKPWIDEEDLLPGHNWQLEIKNAVKDSDAVLVCLSNNSITKQGFIQKEIKYALDIADEQPENTIFLIPVRLEDCKVPDRLSKWQWVDLFKEGGYVRLLYALHNKATSIGKTVCL